VLFYADEASVSLSSYSARTYAPRGKPAVLPINSEVSRRLYLASAISTTGELFYEVREKAFDGSAIVDFLRHLLAQVAEKVLIIWDNASIHDCEKTRQFLRSDPQAQRLHLAKQPTYSPQLNADEQVWSQLKGKGLSNTCYQNVKELKPKIIEEMEKLKQDRSRIQQFFHHPDLGFL
jgi:transposase